ncbi:MAG: hypothetical protein AAF959_11330 [Cyanobacteria bacterium P01_D01_bin.56]
MTDWDYNIYGAVNQDVTILYRVDLATESQLWISENGVNVQLGTYQLQHDISKTVVLNSHLAGVDKGTISGLDITSFPVFFTHGLSSNTAENDYTELTTTPISSADITQSAGAFAPSVGVDARSYVDIDRTDQGSSFAQSVAIRYFFPSGEYQGTATGTLEATASTDTVAGGDYTARQSTAVRIPGLTFGEYTNDFVFTSPGTQGPTTFNLTADNYASGPTELPIRHSSNGLAVNITTTVAGNNSGVAGDQTRSEVADLDLATLQVRHRPLGALSRSQDKRFVTIEYFDNAIPKIDYYVIDNALFATKTTATYPSVPAVDVDDPAQFWITKVYEGSSLGQSFSLNNSQTPDPAFNVSAGGDLIQFLDYDTNLSVYAQSSVTLVRDINGSTRNVTFKGLGLTPDKLVAIAGLA